MKEKIEAILNEALPECAYRYVSECTRTFGPPYIRIEFAAKNYNINGVSGQMPQLVSLVLDINTMELNPQIFGGNGGQSIYRKPNLEVKEEKYLAMKSVKIPFKRPKPEEKFILSAIKRFAENWLQTLKDNREVLKYAEYVDYNELLN